MLPSSYRPISLLPSLTKRFEKVVLSIISLFANDYIIEEYPITACVAQGSALEPILHVLFTTDIPKSEKIITSTLLAAQAENMSTS